MPALFLFGIIYNLKINQVGFSHSRMRVCLLFLISLLSIQNAVACSCGAPNVTGRYMVEDFIGVVAINSIEESEYYQEKRVYKAKLDSVQTFKGAFPDSVFISGTLEKSYVGQCEISVRPGQKWLLYLQQEKNGHYILSWCDNPLFISGSSGEPTPFAEKAQNQIEKLTYLRKNFPNLHSEFRIYYDLDIYSEFFVNVNNLQLDMESAYYMLTFNTDVEVDSVEIIKGFGEKVDQRIIRFLKTDSLWHGGNLSNPEYSIPYETKYLINMNYSKELKRVGF